MIDYESIYRDFAAGRMLPFYKTLYPGLLTFASRLLGPSLAFMSEDCVQDAVLAAYEHRDNIEGAVHLRWYIFQCVRRRVSNLLRHKGVTDEYASAVNDGALDSDRNMERDYSYDLIRQETLDSLFAAIERLPEQYRQIFSLNFEAGLKNQEIARMLDVAEITVKKRKARMIELLRAYLGSDPDVFLAVLFIISINTECGKP